MAIALKTVKQLDKLTTVPNTVDVIVNDANGVTKRAQLSDVLSLDNIPSAALERLVKVANQTARYALTTSDVQLGDSVLQLDTGIMYIVVDTTKLNSADGYQEYKAGTAAKAYSDESGNNIKSNYASSLEISNGSVLLKNKNGTTLSTQSLPSTVGTFYGTETTASASAQAKTATVTNNDFALSAGVMVIIKFVNTNIFEATASNHITLNVNSTGAKSITIKGNELPLGDNPNLFGRANYYNTYVYDGTYWVWQSCSIKATDDDTHIFTGTYAEWIALSTTEQDTYDIINITDDDGTPRTFVGTHAQWDALSASEKAGYVFVEFIDDGGYGNSYDIPYNSTDVGTKLDSLSTDLGSKSSASSVTGNDAFSKIATLKSSLTTYAIGTSQELTWHIKTGQLNNSSVDFRYNEACYVVIARKGFDRKAVYFIDSQLGVTAFATDSNFTITTGSDEEGNFARLENTAGQAASYIIIR